MAYIVTKTNGQILATIKDGTVDTSTSLSLVGKNYIGYGEVMAENLLHLLENFAAPDAPVKPTLGQIWFNTATKQLSVYSGNEFVPMLKSTISPSQPTLASVGDSWWNTQTKKFSIYDGTEWQEIGPLDTSPYAKLTQNNQFLANVIVNQTLFVGNAQSASISASASGTVTLKNNSAGKDLLIGVKLANETETTAITINGTTGQAEVLAPIGAASIANKAYIDGETATLNASITSIDTKANNINSNLISSVSSLTTLLSQLQQNKADINSPALTGTPTAPTPALNTTSKQIVNAEFVQNNLVLKANLDSPLFTGTPQAPTASVTENSGVLATTAFVKNHCNSEILNNATLTGVARATTPIGADNSTAIATTAFVHGLLPRGAIIMWSGVGVPAGWAVCDGTNGTPDLRNKFIVGAGPSYALGSTGGASASSATTQAAGSHTHSGATQSHALTIDQLPAHNHVLPGDDMLSNADGIGGWSARSVAGFNYDATSRGGSGLIWRTSDTGGNQGHAHNIAADGNHTHTIAPISTIPPYYALAYIMKVY